MAFIFYPLFRWISLCVTVTKQAGWGVFDGEQKTITLKRKSRTVAALGG
jgi:hypothetical protein